MAAVSATTSSSGEPQHDGEVVLALPLRQRVAAGQRPCCSGCCAVGKEARVEEGRVRHDAEPAEDALGVPDDVVGGLVERAGLRHGQCRLDPVDELRMRSFFIINI